MKITVLILLLSLQLGIYSQTIDYKISNDLKTVKIYYVNNGDTILTNTRYYENGNISKEINFVKKQIVTETVYKYKNSPNKSVLEEKINNSDSSKTVKFSLFDQNGDKFYTQITDSSKKGVNINFEFENHIYKDTLLLYSNWINPIFNGYQSNFLKYEYNENGKPIKIYCSTNQEEYKPDQELFYDKDGNLTQHKFNLGLIINYTYDKGNLIREVRTTNSKYVPKQEELIKYNYDIQNRLLGISQNKNQAFEKLYKFEY